MYHSVTPYERDPHQVTVHPERLDAQFTWLRRGGLVGVGVGTLLAARRRGAARGLVGLTFDDGYRDFADTVVPILHRHGFGATVYVLPGLFGGHNHWDPDGERKDLMTADEVAAVAGEGVEIGAHGMTHVPLDAPIAEADLVREVGESRQALEDVVRQPVTGFCYPYGAHDERAVAAVRAAGYGHACATGRPPAPGDLALPRTYVGDRDGAVRLAAKWARHTAAERREGGGTRLPRREPPLSGAGRARD
ncbi:polysaccharide deacetylase family protein [Actinomycetospora sp. TBRC 11914]|nr:polysaccharide deacetylase family protein [Actinomycetospora sp. TBRC 11914]